MIDMRLIKQPIQPMSSNLKKKTEVDLYMGVSLNGGTTISHPQMIIFSRSLPMVVGETHHLRKHPYMGIYYLEDHPG